MKIGIIPDVHGCAAWKENVKKFTDCEKIIFLGDYVDSFNEEENGANALKNLEDIISFKKNDPRVKLLIGNHDLENYIYNEQGRCSGFQKDWSLAFNKVFTENLSLFDAILEYDGWVFTHAGVSSKWFEDVIEDFRTRIKDFDTPKNPVSFINALWKTKSYKYLSYNSRDYSGIGDSSFQTPLWIRPAGLLIYPLFHKQVVGHTEFDVDYPYKAEIGNDIVYFLDTPLHNRSFILNT